MMPVRYPLSLLNVEDLSFERGIDNCHETVRLWWNRFGPMFAAETRRKPVQHRRAFTHWRWHLDEVYIGLNGEVLDSFVTKTRDKAAALKFIKKAMKVLGAPDLQAPVADGETIAPRTATSPSADGSVR
jgi:putative transposase